MDYILNLDKELDFQRPVCLHTLTASTIIHQKLVDSLSAPGVVAIEKWNFPSFGHKRNPGMGQVVKDATNE